jgi:uncharacterized protein (DUF1015 family)
MATLRPFRAFRPKPEFAAEVAAKPYDVLNSDEARDGSKGPTLSPFCISASPKSISIPSIDIHDPIRSTRKAAKT